MQPQPVTRLAARDWLAIAGILALAALLRLREAAAVPFWFDEIYTLWMTRLPWGGMFHAVASDIHPPLHFVLLKSWRAIGGEGEVWIRSLSIVAGLGTIGASMALARDAFGNRAALMAGLLIAVHLIHVGVSSEARFYELMALCVWTAAFAAHRWVVRGGRFAAALLVLSMTAGMLTHYLTGLVWLFLFAWGAVVLRGDRRRLLHWIGLHAAAAALFSPQLPTFLAQLGRNAGSHWIQRPDLEDLVTLWRRSAFGAWYLVPPVAYLATLPFVRPTEQRAAALIASIALGPILLTWGLTMLGAHLFTGRYMFYAMAGSCVLMAGGLAGMPWRPVAIAAAALVFAGLGFRTAWIKPPVPEAAGMRAMRRLLIQRAAPGEPIVCGDTHTLAFLQHYGSPTPPWMALPEGDLPYWEGAIVLDPSWMRPLAAVDTLAATGSRWWFVRLRTGGIDTRSTLARVVAAGGHKVGSRDSLTVWRVDPPAPAPSPAAEEPAAR